MIVEVFITPVDNSGNYSLPEVNATQWLAREGAISKINNTVDNSDFVVGVFSFSYTKIRLQNRDGLFSEAGGISIFPYQRDESRVRIQLRDIDTQETFQLFSGLISDDATKEDDLNELISFTIISSDAVLSRHNVPVGIVPNQIRYKQALLLLLDRTPINNILNIDESRIDLDYNGIIENGESFTDKSVSEAVNEILVAANSILYVDENDNLHIAVRTSPRTIQAQYYGPFDEIRRDPKILAVRKINNGYHRMINQVKIDRQFFNDPTYIDAFGLKSKTLELDFLLTAGEKAKVANNLIKRYRYPKREMTIVVPIRHAYSLLPTSLVAVEYEKKLSRPGGDGEFSRYDIAEYDVGEYPGEHGSLYVSPSLGWIVYGIQHDVTNFITEIKLREYGTESGDAVIFDVPNTYDFALYDRNEYESDDGIELVSSVGYYDSGFYDLSEYS